MKPERIKFTPRSINALQPKAERYIAWDIGGDGLGVRVSSAGKKSFIYAYRFDGTARMMTIGTYPKVTLAEANKRHGDALAMLAKGIDPGALKIEERRAKQDAHTRAGTYQEAVEAYIENYKATERRTRTADQKKRRLLVHGAEWLNWNLTRITPEHLIDCLDAIVNRGSPYEANRAHSAFSSFFKWCRAKRRIRHNPMADVEKPFKAEQPSDRHWNDAEIKKLWAGADKLGGTLGGYVKVLSLLGQRPREVAAMTDNELDLDAKLWTIPAERSKNGRAHAVPLPSLVVRILKKLPRKDGNPHLFPGKLKGRPIDTGEAMMNKIREASEIADYRNKEARHTFRTGLDRLGIQPHIKVACLNHTDQTVGGKHYSHHDYIDEKREAFDKWAEHVSKLVFPDGVVRLHG